MSNVKRSYNIHSVLVTRGGEGNRALAMLPVCNFLCGKLWSPQKNTNLRQSQSRVEEEEEVLIVLKERFFFKM